MSRRARVAPRPGVDSAPWDSSAASWPRFAAALYVARQRLWRLPGAPGRARPRAGRGGAGAGRSRYWRTEPGRPTCSTNPPSLGWIVLVVLTVLGGGGAVPRAAAALSVGSVLSIASPSGSSASARHGPRRRPSSPRPAGRSSHGLLKLVLYGLAFGDRLRCSRALTRDRQPRGRGSGAVSSSPTTASTIRSSRRARASARSGATSRAPGADVGLRAGRYAALPHPARVLRRAALRRGRRDARVPGGRGQATRPCAAGKRASRASREAAEVRAKRQREDQAWRRSTSRAEM